MSPSIDFNVQDATAELHEELQELLAGQTTLEHVVRWGLRQSPAKLIVDVVKQDEFTQDVIIPFRGHLHLVYDTT